MEDVTPLIFDVEKTTNWSKKAIAQLRIVEKAFEKLKALGFDFDIQDKGFNPPDFLNPQ